MGFRLHFSKTQRERKNHLSFFSLHSWKKHSNSTWGKTLMKRLNFDAIFLDFCVNFCPKSMLIWARFHFKSMVKINLNSKWNSNFTKIWNSIPSYPDYGLLKMENLVQNPASEIIFSVSRIVIHIQWTPHLSSFTLWAVQIDFLGIAMSWSHDTVPFSQDELLSLWQLFTYLCIT